MITITVVRHGESTDNLKPLWAGWSDAPLSNHGMNQAKALGEYMKDTRFDAIVASDLKRARWTAEQIHQNQAEPKPPLTISEKLREQNFGIAERKPFGEDNGGYVRLPGRAFKFENGESLEDVRQRANDVIAEYIEASLRENQGKPPTSKHIGVVAHGIFNSEFTGALLARRASDRPLEWGYKGMTNTGWTRIELGYADEQTRTPSQPVTTDPAEAVNPSSRPTDPPPQTPINKSLPPLSVKIIATDVTKHLEGVHRQKGGIGSSGFDEKQKDLRAFFSGATKSD